MDSQADSGGTDSAESPNSESFKSAESQQSATSSSTFDDFTSRSIDEFDPFGDRSGGGRSLNSSWDSSYLQFIDNDPMLSSTAYDQTQIKSQLSQGSIATSSLGPNSNYIALPSRCSSTVHSPIKAHRTVTVTYCFQDPYQDNDDDQSDEWTYFDPNGTRVDNPTMLRPKIDQSDFNDLGTNLCIDFEMEPSSSPPGLNHFLHQNGTPPASTNSETIPPLPVIKPNTYHDHALNNREEPQLSVGDPQVISSDPNSFQLKQSTEPSNLVVNMFKANVAQNPDQVPNQMDSEDAVEQPQPPVSPQVITSPNDHSIQLEQPRIEPSTNLVVNLSPKNAARVQDLLPNQIDPIFRKEIFPNKLWALINDPQYPQLNWSPDGRSIVFQLKELKQVMSKFSQSHKIATFFRQLHLYGFSKPNRLERKRDRSLPDVYKFQNHLFQRDHPELVDRIKRRYTNRFEGKGGGSK